jgi:hypothetical protein
VTPKFWSVEQKNLSMLSAVAHAFLGKELTYYPRQGGVSVDAKTYLKKIEAALKPLDELEGVDEKYLDRAKDSLKEVKDLTEYQDQKSARLLTIIAFLTAAAGALFAKFVDAYPLRLLAEASWTYGILVALVYFAFCLFIVFVASGALVSFHATQTRFVWSEINSDPDDKVKIKDKPGEIEKNGVHKNLEKKNEPDEAIFEEALSYLFYKSILRTTPEGWAASFVTKTKSGGNKNSLTLKYYKNYITESYLVALKCGDKLRYLQPAQKLLQCGIRLLIFWLVCFFVVIALVPSKAEVDMRANVKTAGIIADGCPASGQSDRTAGDGGNRINRMQQRDAAGSGTSVSTVLHGQGSLTSGAASAAQTGSVGSAPATASESLPDVTGHGGKP